MAHHVTVMTPDDQPNPAYLVVGDIPQPVALLALVSLSLVLLTPLFAAAASALGIAEAARGY